MPPSPSILRRESLHASADRAQERGLAFLEGIGLPVALFAAAGTSLVSYVRGRIPWNADMAMVGLTARDIHRYGVHPVFFEGSEYAGTLEQHWVSLWFWLFGDSVRVHRLAIAALLLGVVAIVWAIALAAFGRRAAFWAGLYVALGPPFFTYRGLTSEGPYTPIYLIGAAILLLLLHAELRARAGRPVQAHVVALGFLGGIGWWTHPLTLVWGACALVAPIIGRLRRAVTPAGIVGGIAAFFAGSFPWWVRNVETGWMSLRGQESGLASANAALAQLRELIATGVPVLLGTRSMWAKRPLFPGGVVVAWAILLAAAAWGIRLALRREDTIQRFAARLLLPLLLLSPGFAFLSARTNFVEPRLLYPFYFAIAPLVGAALATPDIARNLRIAIGGSLLLLHAWAHMAAPVFPRTSDQLLAALRERHVDAFYGSYWDVYTIDYLSDGAVTGTPFGNNALTRRQRESAIVDAAPDPAFLLNKDEAPRMQRLLRETGTTARVESLDGRLLVREVPPRMLAALRRCLCVPDRLPPDGP